MRNATWNPLFWMKKQLAEAEPKLRRGLAGGLLVPGDGVVYAPCVARYLVEKTLETGRLEFVGKRARSVADGQVTFEDGQTLSAAAVVNAAGTAARHFVLGLDIQPRKGHLLITDRYPGFVRRQIIELGYLKSAHSISSDSVAFNVQPRQTGQLLIGSSRQYGTEDPAIEQAMLARMLKRALEYMPGLAGCSGIRAWTEFSRGDPRQIAFDWPLLPVIRVCMSLPGMRASASPRR